MIEVIHADAFDIDPAVIASAHVQIIDPPYSPHVHQNAVSAGMMQYGVGPRKRDFGFEPISPELREYIMLVASALPRWTVVFSDFEGARHWIDESASYAEYVRAIPWIRWSQPQKSGDRPPTGREEVICFHAWKTPPLDPGRLGLPVRKRWNGPGSLLNFGDAHDELYDPESFLYAALSAKSLRGDDKHETEKPLDLMLDLVSYFSDPGETVVDLCGGRGTTAQACRLLGRGCLCVEKDEKEASLAQARVVAPLSKRDYDRAYTWTGRVDSEAARVPTPKDKSMVKTWERAQRRRADVQRVRDSVKAIGMARAA